MLERMKPWSHARQAGIMACILLPTVVSAQWGDDPLQRAARLADQLDRPVPSLVIDAGGSSDESSAEDRAGVAVEGGGEQPAAPSELRRDRGRSRSTSSTRLTVTPGTPAELSVGETVFVGDSPLFPPREVFIGRRLRLDGVTLQDGDQAAEADVEYEDSAPGAGPVVSSGVRARTRVRMQRGRSTPVFETGGESESETSTTGTGGASRSRRTTRSTRRLDLGYEVIE